MLIQCYCKENYIFRPLRSELHLIGSALCACNTYYATLAKLKLAFLPSLTGKSVKICLCLSKNKYLTTKLFHDNFRAVRQPFLHTHARTHTRTHARTHTHTHTHIIPYAHCGHHFNFYCACSVDHHVHADVCMQIAGQVGVLV